MKNYPGGYIFIPTASGHSPSNIIMTTIQRMGTLRDIRAVSIWQADDEDWVDVPLPVLCRAGRGCVHLYIDGIDCMLHFTPNVGKYHIVSISVYDSFLIPGRYHHSIEAFVARWAAFCEEIQAAFGYFGRLGYMAETAYRDTVVLPALQQGDIAGLLGDLSTYWLLHLGPALAAFGKELEMALIGCPLPLEQITVRDGAMGAVFIQTSAQARIDNVTSLWEIQRDIDKQSEISW